MALPPVVRSVVVPLGRSSAFELFVRRIAEWWPLATRSISGADAVSCAVEERPGGRIYERARDGSEHLWGRMLVWVAPARLGFTWQLPGLPEAAATEVEVRFTDAEGATRVDLEHRHWERLGADAALLRGLYDGGWPSILERFVALASDRELPPPPTAPGCLDTIRHDDRR
jgi:uncharacterized protein YndB with AHSA1/START domain